MHALSRRVILTSFAALSVSPHPAIAQIAQDQMLRIVFPYSAGGSADAVARLIAEHLQGSLGRPVIVDNKVGAGGRIGARVVKDALPDGTTLLFAAAAQMTIQPHIYADLGYDPFVHFVPVSQTVRSDLAFAVSGQVPARSIKELIAWFKSNPVQALYGSPGAGTSAHFAGMELARICGLELRHVAYRGTSAALPDLLAGRIPLYVTSVAEIIQHHRSGVIRILAMADASRSELLPDVPTLRESGIDIDAQGWFAFYAPAQTPRHILDHLEPAIIAATGAPAVRAKIAAMGFQPTGTTAEELGQIQRSQFNRWRPIIKASGFKAEE
jgi:tripartite-type tricarboxylate transporter receptor subunit TctC